MRGRTERVGWGGHEKRSHFEKSTENDRLTSGSPVGQRRLRILGPNSGNSAANCQYYGVSPIAEPWGTLI